MIDLYRSHGTPVEEGNAGLHAVLALLGGAKPGHLCC